MSLAEDAKPTDLKVTYKQKCPLCGEPANFIFVDNGRSKRFSCNNCKVFVIYKDSVKDLAKQPKIIRDHISKKSNQCPNDMVLLIYTEDGTKEFTGRCESENNWW